MKITFNSPFVLIFVLISVLCLVVQTQLGAPLRMNVLQGHFDFRNWQDYVSLVGHAFGHADTGHLLGNLSILLLIGPVLENDYGTKKLMIFCLITCLVISVVHIAFWEHSLMGASGIVFMMIVLVSLDGSKKREIPMTFLLIVLLFIGQEIWNAFQDDQVSQFAHILGGATGAVLGYLERR